MSKWTLKCLRPRTPASGTLHPAALRARYQVYRRRIETHGTGAK